MDEFQIIKQYFSARKAQRNDVKLGVGDDCALLEPPLDHWLVATVDTLISGRHFFPDADPSWVGHKALAVSLSDIASMGAEPAWVMMTLSLPSVDTVWLEAFAKGFYALAEQHHVQLVGGDLTKSDILSITVQVTGFVPRGKGLKRSGALPGDLIYVSGHLGGAGLAVQQRLDDVAEPDASLQTRLNAPEPRVALGLGLRDIATAAVDVSDGLLADLEHILASSGVGAVLRLEDVPISPKVHQIAGIERAHELALSAGGDYELCFTVSPDKLADLEQVMAETNMACYPIGQIDETPGLRILQPDGSPYTLSRHGYKHF